MSRAAKLPANDRDGRWSSDTVVACHVARRHPQAADRDGGGAGTACQQRSLPRTIFRWPPRRWMSNPPCATRKFSCIRRRAGDRRHRDAHFLHSSHRRVHQDCAFGIRQLVDIVLRAPSPGIDDTTTAVMCVEHLTAVPARLASRDFPAFHRYEDGELRQPGGRSV